MRIVHTRFRPLAQAFCVLLFLFFSVFFWKFSLSPRWFLSHFFFILVNTFLIQIYFPSFRFTKHKSSQIQNKTVKCEKNSRTKMIIKPLLLKELILLSKSIHFWLACSKQICTNTYCCICVCKCIFFHLFTKKLLRMYMDGYALETITFSHKLHRKRGMLIHKYRLTLLGLFGNIEWLQCLHVWCKALVNPFVW